MIPQIKKNYDNAKILPLKDLIFDREKFVKDYKTMLYAGEDFDLETKKLAGCYLMKPKFNLVILVNMEDPEYSDELLKMAMDQIDHIDSFNKVYINPAE